MNYFADFETTQLNSENETSVYLWCIVGDNFKKHGFSIETFYYELTQIEGCVYFHNLKFDFSFLHPLLINNEIEYTILEKNGTIYSVRFSEIELRDTLNYFTNMTLEKVGLTFNKTYFKTKIEHTHKKGELVTVKQIEYCFNDTFVLKEAYNNYMNELETVLLEVDCISTANSLNKKLTNAGIAYSAFKEISNFKKLCPQTTTQQYELFKGAYKGGLVFAKEGLYKNIQMIDCNSMYPFCYSSKKLPIGKPIPIFNFEKLKKYDFFIVNINIEFNIKENIIPFIGGGIGKYGGTNYLKETNEPINITVCNIDLQLIERFYNCSYEIVYAFGFRTKEKLFSKYCETFLKVKNENEGSKKIIAKIMLNSPYGKTAMSGVSRQKNYYIDDEQILKSKQGLIEIDEKRFEYLPIAIAITAYAREVLLLECEKVGFENIVYTDTDSIKFINTNNYTPTNQYCLGGWKDEGVAEILKVVAPKKYATYCNGKIDFKCAGFSQKTLLENLIGKEYCNNDFTDSKIVSYETSLSIIKKFKKGLELPCLQSKVVKGGRALIPVFKKFT